MLKKYVSDKCRFLSLIRRITHARDQIDIESLKQTMKNNFKKRYYEQVASENCGEVEWHGQKLIRTSLFRII